ncbi:MAG TPA: TIGR02281 family clan AA aspartic protease [Phenylobacterium sp.]|nr:TIGR02281 family clan AA aspartic protease [Phenylobacterium sp.]HQN50485.1 TIGR02281 family clan AA aspartic protease [Phenylobacterium sp.]
MSDTSGPWGPRDPVEGKARKGDKEPLVPTPPTPARTVWPRGAPAKAPRAVSGLRVALWIGLVTAICAMVFGLAAAYPGAVSTDEDWMWAIRGLGFAVLLSAALLRAGPIAWRQALRHITIWGALVVGLLMGYAYRGELQDMGQKVLAEVSGGRPVTTRTSELVVTADEGGGFMVVGQLDGKPVRFLVDTGASDIVLSPADAERLGYDPKTLKFDRPSETANGIGYGAEVMADNVSVGPIRFDKVPVSINQAPMRQSLLGMSFLNRLEGVRIEGDKLYLKYKAQPDKAPAKPAPSGPGEV